MGIISIKNLVHRFSKYGDNGEEIGEKTALEQVSLDIEKGSFVAILGHNGSGKSTLAKHLNALLPLGSSIAVGSSTIWKKSLMLTE